mmetsp:Transcript_11102/g.33259  ORF Transcript_11102/g.33259 Transcript_11102/m.33259 type:complete len:484 (+) Transcript_11102:2291-3742(+)
MGHHTNWTVEGVTSNTQRHLIPVSTAFHQYLNTSAHAELRELATFLTPAADETVQAKLLEQEIWSVLETYPNDPDSEHQIVISASNVVAALYEVFAGRQNRRDRASDTTSGRPDDVVVMLGHQVFFGELKDKNMRLARNDCVSKTPFAAWHQHYGNLPFVFAYAMSGADAGRVLFEIGVLSSKEHRWRPLFDAIDLMQGTGRAKMLTWSLRVLPYLCKTAKYLSEQDDLANLNWTKQGRSYDGRTDRCLSLVTINGEVNVQKRWTFKGPTASEDSGAFSEKLGSIYRQLAAREGDQQPPIACAVPNHFIHVSSDKKSVHGYFAPHGFVLSTMTLDDGEASFALAKGLFHILQYLRQRQVIHHDLRPDNIICTTPALKTDSKFLAIDFDDAEIVPAGAATVPGRIGLNVDSHAPNIVEEHGYEVDVWGVGFILAQKGGSLSHVGEIIKRDYKRLSGDLDGLQGLIVNAGTDRALRLARRENNNR